jgi:hypothetical protein
MATPPGPAPAAEAPVLQSFSKIEVQANQDAEDERAAAARAEELRGTGRRTFGGVRAQLFAWDRPGWVRRWFNDTPGGIPFALECGWQHVIDTRSKENVQMVVDKTNGLKAFYMELPRVLFDDDMKVLQQRNDLIDAQIHRGAINQQPGHDAAYNPLRPDGRAVIDYRSGRQK